MKDSPPRSPNAVNVRGDRVGEIVIDHRVHPDKVNSSPKHISGDKHPDPPASEVPHNSVTLKEECDYMDGGVG